MSSEPVYVRDLADLGRRDGGIVGGKNASLGEMIRNLHEVGVRVPAGFATTAEAYWRFVDDNDLRQKISDDLDRLKGDRSNLSEVGEIANVDSIAAHGLYSLSCLLAGPSPDFPRETTLSAVSANSACHASSAKSAGAPRATDVRQGRGGRGTPRRSRRADSRPTGEQGRQHPPGRPDQPARACPYISTHTERLRLAHALPAGIARPRLTIKGREVTPRTRALPRAPSARHSPIRCRTRPSPSRDRLRRRWSW